jgi:hypothetical protein
MRIGEPCLATCCTGLTDLLGKIVFNWAQAEDGQFLYIARTKGPNQLKNGYIGSGPPDAKIGDQVFLLFGSLGR